jgi:PAS domain S-box-containing protein
MGDPLLPDGEDAAPVAFGLDALFDLTPDLLIIAAVDGYLKRVNPAFERTLGYSTNELLSRPFFDFIHPDDRERTREALAALGRGEELHEFENRYIRQDGSIRWLQWNARPGPAGLVAAAARDVTDSLARKEQAALRRVATLVAHGAPPAEVFNAVAAEVAPLLAADAALVCHYEPDATLTVVAESGAGPLSPEDTRVSLDGDNLAAMIRRNGQPAWINYDGASGAIASRIRGRGFRCGVGAPILVDDRIWGVMIAWWRQPRQASSETADRIAEFTDLVAIAIANAESRAELFASRARVVAASDDARRQIERDLHDGAQQQLVTLALKLRSLTSTIPPEAQQLYADVADVASGLEGVIDELRELSRGIHPTVLTRRGLGPALTTLARRAPLPVEVDVKTPERLPERIEVAVYYVVAESLTNVAKHGQASVVTVDVVTLHGRVRVSVYDDGVGGADPKQGSGLLGLRDRVEALGGSMSLNSPSGGGTSIVADIPAPPVPPLH